MRTIEARLETRDGEGVCLDGVSVEGTLDGALFEATLEQRFRNPRKVAVEVAYTFPLPWGAILLGVDVQLGERRLEGRVIEKCQAEAEYEDAIADGNAAIMLEQNGDGSFTANLGNLAPGERCVVRVRYAQVLQFQQRSLRVLIPTVIAPRYGDPLQGAGLRPHQTVEHDLTVQYPFALTLRLGRGLTLARVGSPSHPISVKALPEDAGLEVTLSKTGALDRDFVLSISELEADSLAVSGADFVEPGVAAALVSFCPRLPRDPRGVALKMLVDCSGSMLGDSIAAARRALVAIVERLEPDDRFSLSRFGSCVEHRSRGLWRTTEATRAAARRWAMRLGADMGGTEMEDALLSTFALAGGDRPASPVDVLLVTDGEIHAIERTLAAAEASGHRIFAVGIGSSPAEGLVRRLAEVSGGACDFVAPGEAVEPAVMRMFARLRSVRMSELQVEWPEGAAPLWTSRPGAALFDADTATVFGSFASVPEGEVRLLGRRSSDAPMEILARATLGPVRAATAVSRLAAASRLTEVAKDRRTASQAEALRLAIAYQLVTTRTNFLLVYERAEADKACDMPELAKVKSMLPAGWGGTGSVVAAARSAPPPYDVPAVFRSGVRFSRPRSTPGAGAHDIPAFLRLANDEVPAEQRVDPRIWSQQEHYAGLTPFGLSEWLCRNPLPRWPKSYARLREIGVGQPVVEWLELVVASDADEEAVVLAFLSLLTLPEIAAELAKSHGVLARIRGRVRQFAASTHGGAPRRPVPDELVARLAPMLEALEVDKWPACVFALESAMADS